MQWRNITDYKNHKVIYYWEDGSKYILWEIKKGKIISTNNREVKNVDIATFEILENFNETPCIARDKNHFYYFWKKMKNIDRNTFEYIGDNYYKDCNNVYAEYETSLRPLKGSDVDSFKYLGNGYAFDKHYGYYYGTYIRSCKNPTTLEIVKVPINRPYCGSSSFAKDETNVYNQTRRLKNCDIDSWQPIDSCYSKDNKSIFYNEDKLVSVDINSWEYLWQKLGEDYSKDNRFVFIGYKKLPNTDVQSWEHLGGVYSKDKNQVYYFEEVLDEENPDDWTKEYVEKLNQK